MNSESRRPKADATNFGVTLGTALWTVAKPVPNALGTSPRHGFGPRFGITDSLYFGAFRFRPKIYQFLNTIVCCALPQVLAASEGILPCSCYFCWVRSETMWDGP